MSLTASREHDPLTALVHRLSIAELAMDDGSVPTRLGEGVQIGTAVHLLRRGDDYFALVRMGDEVLAHRLEAGLGRLVWTIALASAGNASDRAIRVLAEAGIVTR